MIRVTCPECHAPVDLPEGALARCRRCGARLSTAGGPTATHHDSPRARTPRAVPEPAAPAARKKAPPWAVAALVVGGLLLLTAFLALYPPAWERLRSGLGLPRPTGGASTGPAAVPTAPAPDLLEVDALVLLRDYEANAVAADAKYKGRLLGVVGQVHHVGSRGSTAVLFLDSGTRLNVPTVACSFGPAEAAALAVLAKGDTVGVAGRCEGKGLNVTLADCALAARRPLR